MSASNRFKEFFDQQRDDQKRCWFCNKTEDDIKAEYFKYIMKQDVPFNDIPWEELVVMTGKLQKPVCAACYFNIRESGELIEDIFNKPEDEVW